jgi:hypothetical protein
MTGRSHLACLAVLTALASVLIFNAASASAGITCVDSFTPCSPSIEISGVSGTTFGNEGTQASYTYHVRNSGVFDDTDVVLTDDNCSPISDPTGDDGDGVLNPGETWNYTCHTTLSGSPGTTINHDIQVSATSGETPVGDETTFNTTITAIHVTKTVDQTTADPFDELTYTITISNDGPDFFSYEGYLNDNGCDDYPQTDSNNADGTEFWLDPGDSVTYTCHHNFNPGPDEGQDANPFVNEACAGIWVYNNEDLAVQSQGKGFDEEVCADASTALAQHVVTGQIFEDMNADGVKQSGEPAFPGIVVYADLNNNGARDAGEPNATSDGAGNYSLTVDLGSTTIREDVPAGTTCSFPSGCAYTVDLPKNSPPPPPDVLSRRISNKAADPSGKDFGDWRPASVSGTVVGDQNDNGTRDAGENGLGGILVFADLNANGILDQGEPSTSSAADGSYRIGGLKPGGYVIRHVLVQDGRTCTAPANCNYDLTLVSNGAQVNKDFLDAASSQLVSPARITPGRARLSGRTGCITGKGFSASLRGRQMQRVTFFVDGHKVKTLTLPKDNRTYRYRVNVSKLSMGHHLMTVKIVFRSNSATKSKTLRLTFQRCAAQLRAPAFTG